ncbi:unnamed protein product [Malus baccata var. baccata]
MSKNIVKDMQDRGEGNEKKSKAMWDDASVEIFISVCVAETLAGNQTDQEFQPYDDDDELLPPGHEEDHRDEEIVDENFTHRREMDVERERIANLLISS